MEWYKSKLGFKNVPEKEVSMKHTVKWMLAKKSTIFGGNTVTPEGARITQVKII